MKEEKLSVYYESTREYSWLLDASYVALNSRALTLLSIAEPFYEKGYEWTLCFTRGSTAPVVTACESLCREAWQRFAERVYADTRNSALREAVTACGDALRRATCGVSDEYDREDAFAEALRRRGLPLQTARNWIVPRDVDAHLYIVDSLGNISGRDTTRAE